MRPLFLIWFCVSAAFAQSVTFKGVVTDAQTGVPVAGAKAELRYSTSPVALDSTETTAPGTFELTAKESGKYVVAASAPGYREAVSAATSTEEKIEVKLPKAGGISGFLRDADTREPVRRTPVRALRLASVWGSRHVSNEELVLTDDEGRFHIEPLPPGEYAILLGNTTPGLGQDGKKIYPVTLWPAGDADSYLPLNLSEGVAIDLGAIDYSRVRISHLVGPKCEGDEQPVQTRIEQRIAGAWFPLDSASVTMCNTLAPLPALAHGRFRLTFYVLQPDFRVGLEEVTLRDDEDTPVHARLLPPPVVTTNVTCDCTDPPHFEKPMQIQFASFNGISGSLRIEAPGTTVQPIGTTGDIHASLIDLPDDLVVKRFLLNGEAVSPLVQLNPDSAISIDIVLSDKAKLP